MYSTQLSQYEIIATTSYHRLVYWYLDARDALEAEAIWRSRYWSPAYTLQSIQLFTSHIEECAA